MVKPFAAIPGPRGPLGLGNLYNYLPVLGKYSWLQLHRASEDKYQKYGPIVRETMLPGVDVVFLFDPNDIALLLNERTYPQRRSHLALQKYRKDRPHIYRSAGLLPTNGEEWWRLRSELQKEMSAPEIVRGFLIEVDAVTEEFVSHLQTDTPFDILPALARLNLELTCLLTFNERMNAFTAEEHLPNSRTSRLIRATETTNSNILPTDQGLQLWRFFETPAYKRIRKAQEYIESVAIELVSQKISFFKETAGSEQTSNSQQMKRSSLIEEYLKNPKLDLSDVVGMAADLLLAGVDTTSYATSFVLYHIARSKPLVQEKLLQESISLLERNNNRLKSEDLRTGVPYTRAVIKEAFRLNPLSIGVGRILNSDLVFSGYRVPAGTAVVTQNMVACRQEKNFPDPNVFIPERWIDRRNSPNPYLVLPFGHGRRACIARRLAEQNIIILLLRMIHNFKITWMGKSDPLDVRTLLINKPADPVTILLQKRN